MKWLNRSLWLLAWSAWALLGFGLAHHLPRSLGPIVSRLPIGKGYFILGFVGDTDLIAVQTPPQPGVAVRNYSLFDARRGESVKQVHGPFAEAGLASHREGLRHGVVFERELRFRPLNPTDPGLYVLDLLADKRLDLWPDMVIEDVVFHPRQPWVAATAGNIRGAPYRAAVFDLRAGKKLFDRWLDLPWTFKGNPVFIPDRDELVLPVTPSRPGTDQFLVVEVWKIGAPSKLASTHLNVPTYRSASVSDAGRLFFDGRLERKDASESSWNDVYDLAERQFLSSYPPTERTVETMRQRNAHFPTISASGRTILRGSPAALYEVGTGRILWQAGPHEELAAPSSQDVFLVSEHWGNLWRKWLPALDFESKAVRSRESGALLYRTPGFESTVMPFNSNANGTLAVLSDGTVRRLPLPINYLLLLLCQSILAVPLVIAWLILWRRKRRALALP